ncbi:uncharacterized protein KRP23_3630 [Phytophthora ramorum]|uniref:uncharacterized protein n=1 Tax=Phytophthora ramorum TaxID=164328 RepID=UPI003098B53C|nr:hypothetical protein KRP23_3630 [Phytophthora ramorum]
MSSAQEARGSIKNDKWLTPTVTSSKQDDSSSLSTRIQAWQAASSSRRKSTSGAVRDYFPVARDMTRSTKLPGGESDGDSSSYSSDESVSGLSNEVNGEHEHLSINKGKRCEFEEETRSSFPKSLRGSSTGSTSTELGEIQQSVQRLRAQRTHVERLSKRNEELERQIAQQKAEKETLQREVITLRGTEQENVAYLQSIKLLERRARGLEEACCVKKRELKSAAEKRACVEQECDQLRQDIQHAQQDHEEEVKIFRDKLKTLSQHIEQLEHTHGVQSEDRKRIERHWKQKMKAAARAHSHTADTFQQQLEQSCKETGKLTTEVRGLEEQVQKLLATTVRQTTVIEECDRVISETRAQFHQAQHNWEEQLQLSCELGAKTQRLEAQVTSFKLTKGSETVELEKHVKLLQTKLVQSEDQLQVAKEALRGKEKEIEVMQRAYVTRDQNRLHTDEVKKELQRNERKLTSELSELQIALRDTSHEKALLSEQVLELQEQLESERKDRSRWATARLKLLAEFCDEESKISSALNHRVVSLDDQRHRRHEKLKASPRSSRKAKNRRVITSTASDDQRYDGDDSDREDMPRQSSIVFG